MHIPFLSLKDVNQSFEPELSAKVLETVKNGWYIRGKECVAFEKRFAEYCGVKHCIGVGNGLEALKLILRAYKIIGLFPMMTKLSFLRIPLLQRFWLFQRKISNRFLLSRT